jgi:hypothetical protein
MSPSLANAGRTTHLKIVVVGLVAGIAFVAVGLNSKITNLATTRVGTDGAVIKAGQPPIYAGQEAFTVR